MSDFKHLYSMNHHLIQYIYFTINFSNTSKKKKNVLANAEEKLIIVQIPS